ncbi:MAG: hypothetical protein R3C26_09455 [Calditrichia bacterium]
MNGTPIANGVVLIKNGKIEKVGAEKDVKIPADYQVLSGKIVTPGLIDAHSVVGLAGMYNQRHDQDQLDKTNAIQPELRALDAYNARDELIEWLRDYGITTVHRSCTGRVGQRTIDHRENHRRNGGGIAHRFQRYALMTLGATVGRNFKSPGTRAKGMAMLRSDFLKAQEYRKKMSAKEKDKAPARDLKMEALAPRWMANCRC